MTRSITAYTLSNNMEESNIVQRLWNLYPRVNSIPLPRGYKLPGIHNSHPYIPGFSYSYGYVDANRIAISNKKTGYFYYDMDVFLRILLLFHVCSL